MLESVEMKMTSAAVPGPIALVGSGEYLIQMTAIESSLLEGRPARYVQLATAAVPDGPEVVEHWHDLGRQQARRLDVEPIIIPVNDRDDANRADLAAMVDGAGLIYLSGGDPKYLAESLRDTLVWEAIVSQWRNGAALAGCSAGAMALTSWVPSLRHPRRGGTQGLGLLPHLRVIPHFDAFAARMPDIVTRFLVPHDAGVSVVGIDEDTAMIGGPHEWSILGRQSAWILGVDGRQEFTTGTTLVTAAS